MHLPDFYSGAADIFGRFSEGFSLRRLHGNMTGRFRLIVRLKTWHINAEFALNNWGTPALAPLQSYLITGCNSCFVDGDRLGITFATYPKIIHEFKFYHLFYVMPIGTEGARLGAAASYGTAWPSDERQAVETNDETKAYQVWASIDPVLSRNFSLRLTAAATINNDYEHNVSGTIYNDHIRTVDLRADYKLHDTFNGWNYLNLTFRQGIGVLGASQQGDALLSNSYGSGIFSAFIFSLVRYQPLTDAWSIKFSATGQFASTALLTSQQFYIGGPVFGRGFYSGTFAGDDGLAGSLELRFSHGLNSKFFKAYQLYGFVDAGEVWNLGGPDISFSPASAGVGLRVFLPDELKADVALTVPLNYGNSNSGGRDLRALLSISKSFEICADRMSHCF